MNNMDDVLKFFSKGFKDLNLNPSEIYNSFDDHFMNIYDSLDRKTLNQMANFTDGPALYDAVKNQAKQASDTYAQKQAKATAQKARRENRRKEFTHEDGSTIKQYFDKDGNLKAQTRMFQDGTREVRVQHSPETIKKDPNAKNMSKVVSTYDGEVTEIHRRPDARHVSTRTIDHTTGEVVTSRVTRNQDWGGGVGSQDIDYSTIEEERLLHNRKLEQKYGLDNPQQTAQEQATRDIPNTPEETVNTHAQTPEQTVDAHNSNAPDPTQSAEGSTRKWNDRRQKVKDQQRAQRGVNTIVMDEASTRTVMDQDAVNITKTSTDANGNVRTQQWRRKERWSGEAELVYDTTISADATYDNITGKYTGPDRSPIDWINADEWDDDYILRRAGDDEALMNSMMNARDRKIQENERYMQNHSETNTVDTPSVDDPIPETSHNINPNPTVDPNNPLTWTESYMDEISEGDPSYYENLKQQKLNAERAERFKNIDPNNPTTWTDEYIQHTASSQDEINNMTQQMRTAKNSDLVDELNQQRRVEAEMPGPNREQRHQIHNDNKQKGNTQKPMTKAEKAKRKKQQQFEARHNAMGNNPDEVKKANQQYNKEQKQKKGKYQQNKNNPNKTMSKDFNENDPLTWTDQDIADMADGDMDLYEDLKARKANAKNGNPHGPNNRIPDEFEFSDAPDVNLNDIDAPDSEWVDDLARNADDMAEEAIESGAKGLGKLGTMDMIMSGVNVLGAIGDYKTARRKGHGVVSSAIRAGTEFAVAEALGLWYLPVQLLKHTPGAVIKGADALYKENRRMNSAATNQVFGDAEFMDTQQLATMRQSGMEMAKMAQYNLQQTLMGNEATYLHR